MKKLIPIVVFFLIVAIAVCIDPTRVVLGRLKGESFFAGRPTSYWGGEILRDSAYAQEALKLPSPESVPVLRELLASDSDEVCFFACSAIGMIGPGAHSAVPDLIAFLRHPNHYYRRNAAFALSTTTDPSDAEAVAALMSLIQESDPWLQYFGSIALGRIGVNAQRAIPQLERLRDGDNASLNMLGKPAADPDNVGSAANWAIGEISDQSQANKSRDIVDEGQ